MYVLCVNIHGHCDVCTLRAESVSTNIMFNMCSVITQTQIKHMTCMYIYLNVHMHNGQLHIYLTYTDSHQSRVTCAYKVLLLYNNLVNDISYTLKH